MRSYSQARGSRGGFTLLEVMIASSIMLLSTTIAVAAFNYTLRCNKAQHSQVLLAQQVQMLQSTLKEHATSAEQFILNGGNTLQIKQPDDTSTGAEGVTSQLTVEDDDGSAATTTDNRVVFTPDINRPNERRVIMTGLGRLANPTAAGTYYPYFAQPWGAASLRVRFRLGDQSRSAKTSKANAYTGVGYQTFVFDSVFMARNNG